MALALSAQQFGTLGQIGTNTKGLRGLTNDFTPDQVKRIGALVTAGVDFGSRDSEQFAEFISTGVGTPEVNGAPLNFDPSAAPDRRTTQLAQRSFSVQERNFIPTAQTRVTAEEDTAKFFGLPPPPSSLSAQVFADPKKSILSVSPLIKPGEIGLAGTTSSKAGPATATATTSGTAPMATDTLTAAQAQDLLQQRQSAPGAARAPNTGLSTDLFPLVAGAQGDSVRNQQEALRRAPAGRDAIIAASPQLGQLSQTLLQQAQDPGGGGFAADFQERIRVQQASVGLSGGTTAAFSEAALTAGALTQRRQAAGSQLQRLGGSFLQQLGIGSPIVADLAGIGQTRIAGHALSAIQAAGEEQSRISQELFNQLSGFLRSESFGSPTTGGGPTVGVGGVGTAGSASGGIRSSISSGIRSI